MSFHLDFSCHYRVEYLRRRAVTRGVAAEEGTTLLLRYFLTFWTSVLISFPLIAVVGFDGSSLAEFVPIAVIAVTSMAALYRMPFDRMLASGAALVLFSLLYFLMFQLFGPPFLDQKFNQFLMVIVVFGALLAICLQDQIILDRLPIGLLIVGLVALALLVINPGAHLSGRASFGEGNPIWMARTVSLAGIAAIWFIVRENKLWAWGLLAIVFAAIALTGSRGPLVSLAAAAGYGLLFLSQSGRAPTFAVIAYGLTAVLLLQISFGLLPQLRALGFEGASGREFLYAYAHDLLIVFPEGIGIGYFKYYQFTYPHNLVLEFLVEWGWFLGGIIVALIVLGGVRLLRAGSEYDILKLAFITEVLNAQFSGDVTTPRMLYALAAVGLVFLPGRANSSTLPSVLASAGR